MIIGKIEKLNHKGSLSTIKVETYHQLIVKLNEISSEFNINCSTNLTRLHELLISPSEYNDHLVNSKHGISYIFGVDENNDTIMLNIRNLTITDNMKQIATKHSIGSLVSIVHESPKTATMFKISSGEYIRHKPNVKPLTYEYYSALFDTWFDNDTYKQSYHISDMISISDIEYYLDVVAGWKRLV